MNKGTEILNALTHLFFPHICPGCGSDLLEDDQLVCIHCYQQLPLTHFAGYYDNPVEKIFWGRIPVKAAASLFYFTKHSVLQQLMHQLKYQGKKEVGFFLGKKLGETLNESSRFAEIDALVPLPLFASRERKRGYNQATILCEGMAESMKIPVFQKSVARVHATQTQTQKNRIERWRNMSGNFEVVDPRLLENKHVLLVDDVITTGATLEACAGAIISRGNVTVSVATLAYTNI